MEASFFICVKLLYIMKEDLYAVGSLAFLSLNKFLYELSICIFCKKYSLYNREYFLIMIKRKDLTFR